MTDLGTSSHERSEAVARVLAALSNEAADGAVGSEGLRDALASEGQSLLDLPEVGLWLALTQGSLIEAPVPDGPVVEVPADGSPVGLVIDLTDVAAHRRVEATAEPESVADAPVDALVAAPLDLDDLPEPTGPAALLAPPPGAPPVAEPPAAAPTAPDPEPAVESEAPAAPRRKLRRIGRRRAADPAPIAVPEPTPVVATPAAEWPDGLVVTLADLDGHLRGSLATGVGTIALPDPAVNQGATPDPYLPQRYCSWRDALRSLVDVAPPVVRAPGGRPAATPGTATPAPYWPVPVDRRVASLQATLRHELAEPLPLRLGPSDRTGDATIDAWWPPATLRRIAMLDGFLRDRLHTDLPIAFADPAAVGTSTPEPYWPPHVARAVRGVESFLASRFALPTTPHVPAWRLAGATHGAVPDPYWPRHLAREGSPSTPPRSADELEHDLASAMRNVALVGDVDLDPFAAEMEIALARLVRTMPLDRIGRVYPATLTGFLVRQTSHHPEPDDFDANVPLTALRRTNAVGLAFSEALVRLDMPVFREVEHRDAFDHRVRYQRRMQLHVGLAVADAHAVLDAVAASHTAGAVSGREVARDWLLAHGATDAAIGRPALRLLAHTDHGERLLDALLDVVRWSSLTGGAALPVDLAPIPPGLRPDIESWVSDRAAIDVWGTPVRPAVQLATDLGQGPVVGLPRSATRWHLNGELLGYGSPGSIKTVPLPVVRSGRWKLTTDSSRRRSPLDIGITSAAPDRVVLAFDERGRYHHHTQPLGGLTATLVAPSGSRVDGVVDRTLLVGHWVGYERIEVSLRGRGSVEVAQRNAHTVSYPVDTELRIGLLAPQLVVDDGDRVVAIEPPAVVFRGHVPAAASVTVTVEGDDWRHGANLAHPALRHHRGAFRLDHLVARATGVVDLGVGVERAGVPAGPPARAPYAPALRGARVGDAPLPSITLAAGASELDLAGWTPPVDDTDAIESLSRLLEPLVAALGSDAHDLTVPLGVLLGTPPLSVTAWRIGIASDAPRLADWSAAHARPLRQWRRTSAPLRNLEALLAPERRTDPTLTVLRLLTAALIAAHDGPHRTAATVWLDDAARVAPNLTRSCTVAALAHADVQRRHPAVRFGAVVLPDPR